ncbi:hypothetical protein ASA1KI_42950 [Opitutales bacterium ASA1]|jgi:hypothetical protein|uniref:DUF4926 domain-containing protein n=1 Tax=Congregicoccus parvus TaxID=3081749 RepID=UPI002B2AF8C2|nr:hypothetical protein ASA1KI_42950 [Opitutales bacterium ASA1]
MKFELYTDVALLHDFPRHNLRRGDIVRPVEHHVGRDGAEGYSVEVLGARGQTLAVVAVPAASLGILHDDEVLSARKLSA